MKAIEILKRRHEDGEYLSYLEFSLINHGRESLENKILNEAAEELEQMKQIIIRQRKHIAEQDSFIVLLQCRIDALEPELMEQHDEINNQ